MMKFPEIPGYKIKKKLGQGGMGSVYLCVEEKLNRLIAIKILNLETIDNPRLAKRFKKESEALKYLNHPNIVSIYKTKEYKHYYYIAMEYLSESLKDKLQKSGKINPNKALHTVMTISEALFYAHKNDVIHRDIKPDNIMFRKDGTPVLLDFGIAKHIGAKTRLTKTGVSIGTPQYMSPEQCNAERLDGRSDIYSLGVVLFEMLTGKIPYTANDIFGIAMKHLKEPIPELKGKNRPYQYLIDRMMEKDKKKRIKTKTELFEIIRDLLNVNSGDIILSKNIKLKKRKKQTEKTIHTGKNIRKSLSNKKVLKKRKKKKKKPILWLVIGLFLTILVLTLIDNPVKDKLNYFINIIRTFFIESKAL